MRLLGLFLLLAHLAWGSHSPAWQHDTEYVYQIQGRTLASLNQISQVYSGVLLRAKLHVRPRPDGSLGAQIMEPQYAQIHTEMDDWLEEIPESELNYQPLPLSSQPFQIEMNNGAIVNVIVEKSMSNWEANFVKAVASQLQLDTQAQNLIPSSINVLREPGSDNAVFKTMEESLVGVSETLYEIHPLPEYSVAANPELLPHKHIKREDNLIEVVKTINFTHTNYLPYYYYGVEGFKSHGNAIDQLLSSLTFTRAVLVGSLDRYVIQRSVTIDKNYVRPTINNKQQGSVLSALNISLLHKDEQRQQYAEISDPVNVGLVYSYNKPSSKINQPKPVQVYDHEEDTASAEAPLKQIGIRMKRNVDSSESEQEDSESWLQQQPNPKHAPETPFMPLTVGFNGQSLGKQQNIVHKVRQLAQTIGQEFKQPKKMLEQNTVSKFVFLTNLVRQMDKEQIKQVAEELYRQQQDDSWVALRDAVAQAATGPALLNIKKWIKKDMVSCHEAATLIATSADAVREPTEQYMQEFFELLEDQDVMQKAHLNESVLLSYTTLVHQVYVNEKVSKTRYPRMSFGTFNTPKGKQFVEQEVIPFLSRQLERAIGNDDSQQIHTYIRALGNVGHRRILQTFKLYMEGQKQASQFQRVLMVLALDKLTTNDPISARPFLYKIYQNVNEFEQVRVAAVYQLMRTQPTISMMQRMAMNTNVEPNKYVNSAVKSIIESVSQLNQYSQLREAARVVLPLLTKENYGLQYSHAKISDYVSENLLSSYLQGLKSFGGEDSWFPKGINYILRRNAGGNYQRIITLNAMVSSVEDLITVVQQQTRKYQELVQEKQRQQQSSNHKWTSEHIAQILGMENEQREQLEANIYLKLGALQKMWSFDNRTIENLPKIIADLEQELEGGKQFQYSKMQISKQMIVSFPTVIGWPFVYSYVVPSIARVKANVRASAQPSVAHNEYLQAPRTASGEYQISAVLSGKVQTEIGFFTPFDHQHYSAGYEQNLQVVLPLIKGRLHMDVENKQAKVEVESLDTQQNINVLHISTNPFTAQYDINNPNPEKQVIGNCDAQNIKAVFGQKSTGIAFSLQMASDRPIDTSLIIKKLQQEEFGPLALDSILNEDIQNLELNVGVNQIKTTNKRIVAHFGYQSRQQPNSNSNNYQAPDKISQESWSRQQELLNNFDGNYVDARAVDAVIQFEGQEKLRYTASAALASSVADLKTELKCLLKKYEQGENPQTISLDVTRVSREYKPFNLDQALESEPQVESNYRLSIQDGTSNPTVVQGQMISTNTKDRKQFLQSQPEFQKCQRQMQEGNNQLPVCARLIAQTSLLNKVDVNIQYENLNPAIINGTYKLWRMLRYNLAPRVSEDILLQTGENSLDISGQYSPDLESFTVSINSPFGKAEARNVPLKKWYKNMISSHPSSPLYARLAGLASQHDAFHPYCVIDQTAVNTLDNKTYPAFLERDWTVALQYVPRKPSSNSQPKQSVWEQLNELPKSYILYVRDPQSGSRKKEVRIVMQTPLTSSKIVDITLQPGSPPQLLINNKQVPYNNQQPQVYQPYNPYMQAYLLSGDVVELRIRDAFTVVYDGSRVKIIITNDEFMDASRGVCGTFSGEPATDFTDPQNNILKDPEEFVQSYTISSEQKHRQRNLASKQNKLSYVRLVPNTESSSRLVHRTRYLEKQGSVCFSLEPLPACHKGSHPVRSVSVAVPVHCVRASNVASLWKNQINEGASIDFRRKTQTEVLSMMVPEKCSA